MVFSPVVDGEDKPPIHQCKLSGEELVHKESVVFDKAMAGLKSYWEGVDFDGHEVSTNIIETNRDDLLSNRRLRYDTVKTFLACPVRDLHKFSNLVKEYKSVFKHIDRHSNEIIFVKCDDRSCCTEWKLKSFVQKFKMQLFAPSTTTTCGHYDTFLQSCIKDKHVFSSSGQPSCGENDLGKCEYCPNYCFKSKTEKARHKSVYHRRQNVQAKRPTINCDVCEASFGSLSSLNRHKKEKNHTKRDQGIKRKHSEAAPRKTKARTIQDMLRANKGVEQDSDDDDDEEEEEECSASQCTIQEINDTNIYWVECEACSKWFHIFCVTQNEGQSEINDFHCVDCV